MENFRHYKPRSSQLFIHERKKYDVFLSFRGSDVRETFVDHLYHSLSTAGLNTFMDSENLEKGENIGVSLQQAIENSTMHIPIFSPDYASSVWCLKEVSLMWKLKYTRAHNLLVPLFYNVDPTHVRYPEKSGSPYSDAFAEHRRKGRHSREEIEGWNEALHKVSSLSGWTLKKFLGYEGKLVKQVVEDVLQSLDFGMLYVANCPVGLKARTKEVKQLLKLVGTPSDRLTLGIWGMGGLGKTTLSKALYNQIHHLFEASSFVSKVRLEEASQGLRNLQEQILEDLLKTHRKLKDVDRGKILMRNHLASVRALVILDDVDHERQLDGLMGDWFGEGSRIVITTQDRRVLDVRQVDMVYPMRLLEHAEGVELFSWHAFRKAHPKRGYEDMTERIVKACSGLPLSLEIMGTHLYDRNQIYWTEALHNLKNVGQDPLFEILKISYDSLTHVTKQIFLDIACFFVNLKSSILNQNRTFSMDFYAKFWSALGCEPVYTSLTTLEEKSLIVRREHRYIEVIDEDVDEEDRTGQYFCEFSMHDRIRDMGRRIVREESLNYPAKRSRVWQEEDIRTLMTATTIQENSNVQGLIWRRRMKLQQIDTLAPMQNLNFLLWWKLQVKTQIKRLPANLKYLVLSECQLKDNNPQISGIESEILRAFRRGGNRIQALSAGIMRNFSERPVLPKSIGQLIYLRYLDMSGTKQNCLPKEFCELHCLEELYLSRCRLEALPEAFGNLTKLQTLDVSSNILTEFPPSFACLKSLVNLEMALNMKLELFPALPKGLINLNARRCSRLQEISVMYDMKNLKTVDLSHCKSLTAVPALVKWKSLTDLRLDGCKQLLIFNWNDGPARARSFPTTNHTYCKQKIDSPPLASPPTQTPTPKMQRLCMIGCDNIRLNIYQLLKDLPDLEQLDLSVSPEEELSVEKQHLVGHKNLTVQRGNSCVAVLFCFVFDSNETVRLPQMEVAMTFKAEGDDGSISKTLEFPSRKKGDGSGKYIMRICACKGEGTPVVRGGTINCSYHVGKGLSRQTNPLVLKQVEILLLEKDYISRNVARFLRKWKLLPILKDWQSQKHR